MLFEVGPFSERAAPWSRPGDDAGSRPSWLPPRRSKPPAATVSQPHISELPPRPSSPPGSPAARPSTPPRMSVRPDGAPRLATIPPPAHDEAPDDLDAVVDAIAAFRREVLEGSEREIVSLALAIAERIARTELATDPALVAAWAEEGLASLTREDVVTVHVSAPIEADWPRQLDVDVVVDPQLEPGTCRIVGRYGSVDAGLSARIASLAAALGVDP